MFMLKHDIKLQFSLLFVKCFCGCMQNTCDSRYVSVAKLFRTSKNAHHDSRMEANSLKIISQQPCLASIRTHYYVYYNKSRVY